VNTRWTATAANEYRFPLWNRIAQGQRQPALKVLSPEALRQFLGINGGVATGAIIREQRQRTLAGMREKAGESEAEGRPTLRRKLE
jgi:hypothetical protein